MVVLFVKKCERRVKTEVFEVEDGEIEMDTLLASRDSDRQLLFVGSEDCSDVEVQLEGVGGALWRGMKGFGSSFQKEKFHISEQKISYGECFLVFSLCNILLYAKISVKAMSIDKVQKVACYNTNIFTATLENDL